MPKANKKPTISPITFIDRLVKKNELGQPFTLMDHQREILRLAFTFDEAGRLPWDTIVYSCVKKSGKTEVTIKLHPQVVATLTITVEAGEEQDPADPEDSRANVEAAEKPENYR